ncbi:MAG: amidotransferase 1, exosortase A system-associated [Alphaproteobacteria bacterium]|nr:amidotransferase 1, exosortase A system-associated [Alphaproteobacteria bacterium]MBV9371245.1 amidotransferase 1, exosortase A system-associated [Alphaproteobacteria bacterium]MBV9902816.1 amidotransferase 1, exosortase A system-associated [Alphaproteobacteria bacterium]
MCGIAGLFHPDVPKPVDAARIRAMADSLAHRGPDGSGVWTGRGVGLGHRRLSIIDLETGDQPMRSADGDLVLSYNGEIYNFKELRAELEALGHRFATHSDTEVVLASWRQWGPSCLARFNGMFAFALYDGAEDALFLARDRLGVKPLFLAALPDGALIFASELKGLMAHPRFRREIDPRAVEDYLAYGYIPDALSIMAGVSKLPAGHYLLVRRGRPVPAPVRWWDVDFSSPSRASAAALEEELVERLREAVRSRMVADVPLGAFLSGGVDSSAVVAFMAEASRKAVETCSIGFDEADHDESRWAAQVAARFATSHRTRTVASADFALIDTLVASFDEPFADASALGTYRVSELAREKVTVALSGDGADEAFAGYRRYRLFSAEERVRRLLPPGARSALGAAGALYPKMDWAPQFLRAKTTLTALGRSAEEAYADAVTATSFPVRARLYTPAFRQLLQGHRAEQLYVGTMRQAPADDALSRAQYADLKIWLPGDILTKVDRASMAVSLEAREPLLDHRLVEFAARLPATLRLRGGSGKWLMKKALGRYLPGEILHRRKMGFVTPVGAWFRGPLAAEAAALARSPALAELGWLDGAAVARVATDHRAGRSDHGRLLWQLLMLDRSLQRLFGFGAASPGYSAAVK